jgi:hypothetical protein
MRKKEQNGNGKTPTLELSSGGQRPDRARARVVLLSHHPPYAVPPAGGP